MRGGVATLSTSKLANQGIKVRQLYLILGPLYRRLFSNTAIIRVYSEFANALFVMKANDTAASPSVYPMDSLLAKLSEQKAAMLDHNEEIKRAEETATYARAMEQQQTCNSLPITPSIDGLSGSSALTMRSASANQPDDSAEIIRLRLQLTHAQNKINLLDSELAQSRSVKSDSSQTLSVANTDPDYPMIPRTDQILSPGMNGLSALHGARSLYNRDNIWSRPEDSRIDNLDNTSGSIGRSRGMWHDAAKQPRVLQAFPAGDPSSIPIGTAPLPTQSTSVWPSNRPINQGFFDATPQAFMENQVAMDDVRGERLTPDNEVLLRPQRPNNRLDSRIAHGQNFGGYGSFSPAQMHSDANGGFPAGPGVPTMNASGLNMFSQFPQPPIGTPLSPHSLEFNNEMIPWKAEVNITILFTIFPNIISSFSYFLWSIKSS